MAPSRFVPLVVSAVVFSAFFSAFFLSCTKWDPNAIKDESTPSELKLSAFDFSDIDGIRVSGANTYEVEKLSDGWYFKSGRRAETDAIVGFLNGLKQFDSTDIITTEAARYASLGVDELTGHQVEFLKKGQVGLSLVLGRNIGMNMLIRKQDAVFRVLYGQDREYVPSHTSWLNKNVSTEDVNAVRAVTVSLADTPTYQLSQDEGNWQLDQSEKYGLRAHEVDAQLLQAIAHSVGFLRVETYLSEEGPAELSDEKTKRDVITWQLQTNDASYTRQLTLFHLQDGKIIGQLDNVAEKFTLPEHALVLLRKKPESLRNLRIFREPIPAVAQWIEVRHSKGHFRLSKDAGNQWRVEGRSPAKMTLEQEKITRYLEQLWLTEASSVAPQVSVAAAGLKAPKFSVQLGLPDAKQASLKLGHSADQDLVYALRGGDEAIYQIKKELTDKLLVTLNDLSNAPPAPAAAPAPLPRKVAAD